MHERMRARARASARSNTLEKMAKSGLSGVFVVSKITPA